MKLCASCNRPLGPGYPNRKHCSALCRNFYFKKVKCQQCGGKFRPPKKKPSQKNSGKFCSLACAGKWASSHQHCWKRVSQNCRHCGKPMSQTHHNRKFCSVACRLLTMEKHCRECNGVFKSIKEASRKPRTTFCSPSCKQKWIGRKIGKERYRPTAQENLVAQLFSDCVPQHRIWTGLKTGKGCKHWYQPDIAFPKIKLAVEIDGGIHLMPSKILNDQKRTEILNKLGWTVLRFSNRQVLNNTRMVKVAISSTISKLKATQATR